MQHKSFFSAPINADTLIALATEFEADVLVAGHGRCEDLNHSARIDILGHNGFGYCDAIQDYTEVKGAVITTAECAKMVDAQLLLITHNPRALFINVINALLANNPINYKFTFDEISLELSEGESWIDPSARVMPGSLIGKGCIIEAGAIVLPGVALEDGVRVKTGAVIGGSGAAIAINENVTLSQPHIGTLIIKSGTEIGSLSNLVRGIFGATTIGRRSVIGNQVNIGHNCSIGNGVWVGAGAIIGGYASIGNFTNIGIGALCKNGLTIGNSCNVAMGSCVIKNLADRKSCIGNPAMETSYRLSAGPEIEFKVTGETD